MWERSGSVVEWLTSDRGAGVRASQVSLRCGPWARHIYPSLVLVQPRKTRPCLTERLERKESNRTNKLINVDWNLYNNIISGTSYWCQSWKIRSFEWFSLMFLCSFVKKYLLFFVFWICISPDKHRFGLYFPPLFLQYKHVLDAAQNWDSSFEHPKHNKKIECESIAHSYLDT